MNCKQYGNRNVQYDFEENAVKSYSHIQPGHPRRGIAMLLVIICVGVVTVISLGFLSARSNAPDIGANAINGMKARYVAETGIDIGTAIMECSDIDWRTAHTNGVLINNYSYAGSSITVVVSDLDGNPPTATTQYAVLSANGSSENLVKVVESDIYAPLNNGDVDVDLSEFAIFGNNEISIDNSTLCRWDLSPNAPLREPVRIGINGKRDSSVMTSGTSELIHTNLYKRQNAANTIYSDTSSPANDVKIIDMTKSKDVQMPHAPDPNTTGLVRAYSYDTNISFGTWSLSGSKYFNSVTVRGTAVLQPSVDNLRMLVLHDLYIRDSGTLIVNRNMDVIVQGDVFLYAGGSIQVQNNARFRLFIQGNLFMNNGFLGISPDMVNDTNNPSLGLTDYHDPEKCLIYQVSSAVNPSWLIQNNSFICGLVYTPAATLNISSTAIMGAVTGNVVNLSNGSYLFYDPTLDQRIGYTNPDSMLFEADGITCDNIFNNIITDLNDSTLAAINSLSQQKATDLFGAAQVIAAADQSGSLRLRVVYSNIKPVTMETTYTVAAVQ